MIQLDEIKELLHKRNEKVLSLYLNTDSGLRENQATNPAWRIQLKNILSDIDDRVEGEDREVWTQIRQRAEHFFNNYRVSSKGLAAFFTASDEDTFELPLSLDTESSFGDIYITPLLWAIDEYQRYLVVMVDREKAKFLTAYMGTADVEDTMSLELVTEDWGGKPLMPIDTVGGYLTHGSHVDQYEDRIDEHIERFHKDVLGNVKDLQNRGFDRIILSGEEKSAHALQRMMDDTLKKHVIDVVPMPMRTEPHQVLENILPNALAYERQQEMELVNETIDLAKAGGSAVLGRDAVMEALEQQRIEKLILPYKLKDEELKAKLPLKVFNLGRELEMVHGEAAERLEEEGGIAARLFYTI